MPSPNGYFDCGTINDLSRGRVRFRVDFDSAAAPWAPTNPNTFTWLIETGPSAAGPWTNADLADIATACTDEPDGTQPNDGVTDYSVGIKGLNPGTNVFFRVTLSDGTGQVDQHVCPEDPAGHALPGFPTTFVCAPQNVTDTSATMQYNIAGGDLDTCSPGDTVEWQWGPAGGGFPNTIGPDPASLPLSAPVTGLTPATAYEYRAILRDSGGTAFTVQPPECQFTTLAADTDEGSNPVCTPATFVTQNLATLNGTADSVDTDRAARFAWGTVAGGPYPNTTSASPGNNTTGQAFSQQITGLTQGTTYYYRLELLDGAGQPRGVNSAECSFTTASDTTPLPDPDDDQNGTLPADCDAGGGGGTDVESLILCDKDANGDIVGTALAVYEYDEDGVPTGPPTFVIPGTNTPYVPTGTLGPCEQCRADEPQTFYFTSSTTGPVDFPGRSFSGTLNISRGYAVDQLSIGGTNYPVAITWSILDTEGTEFAEALRQAIQSRIPGSTVTVTPPPLDRCDTSNRPFLIEIACIDQDDAPTDVTIRYDAGTDLVQNPAQLADDGQPAVAPGQLGFQLRQDDDGTYQPQAPHTLDCTSVDGEGWYLTPQARFETWGAGFLNTTPTPRGGSIIELNTTTGGEILHQKVTVPADGEYTLRAFLGGRFSPVTWNLRLSTGDVGAAGGGDIANITQVTPPVGDTPNPQPWSRLEQLSIPLTAGVYTLSMSGEGGRGALYTDLRLFTTDAGTIQSLTANDDCINTRDVTTNTVTCEQWEPQRDANCEIVAWERLDTGEVMTDAAFFAQVPAPVGCYIAPEGEAPEVTFGNLVHTYTVCGSDNENYQRTVLTDNSGAPISESWTTMNGQSAAPPNSYMIGACWAGDPDTEMSLVCADGQPAFREVIYRNGILQSETFIVADGAVITPTTWQPGPCGNQPADRESFCYRTNAGGDEIFVGWARHDDDLPGAGIAYFDAQGNPINPATPGFVVVNCDLEDRGVGFEILCDNNGPFLRRYESTPGQGSNLASFDYDFDGAGYTTVGPVVRCPGEEADFFHEVMCSNGNTFIRYYRVNPNDNSIDVVLDVDDDGSPFVPGGPVVLGPCGGDADREVVCFTTTATGAAIQTGTIRHDDNLIGQVGTQFGWALFNQHQTFVPSNEPGLTFVPCTGTADEQNDQVEEEVVCGIVNGVTQSFFRRVTIDSDGVETVTFHNAAGPIPAAQVTSYQAGDCPDPERLIVCDSNGDPFIQVHGLPSAGNPTGISYFTLDGAPGAPVAPMQLCGPDAGEEEVTEYQTNSFDIAGGVAAGINPTGNLVAWTVRNRNATTATIQINGGPILPLDEAETIGASLSGHDVNDVLDDTVQITPGDGAVRVTITRRV